MENDLISRSEAIKAMLKQSMPTPSVIRRVLMQVPGVDAVIRPVVEQIQWERDCAIEQLKEHNIPFGGFAPDVVKVVRCEDCKYAELSINIIGDLSCCCNNPDVGFYEWRMGLDDFCSYGERREENAAD